MSSASRPKNGVPRARESKHSAGGSAVGNAFAASIASLATPLVNGVASKPKTASRPAKPAPERSGSNLASGTHFAQVVDLDIDAANELSSACPDDVEDSPIAHPSPPDAEAPARAASALRGDASADSAAAPARFATVLDLNYDDANELSSAPERVEEERAEAADALQLDIGGVAAALAGEVAEAPKDDSSAARFAQIADIDIDDLTELSAAPDLVEGEGGGQLEEEEEGPKHETASVASAVSTSARFATLLDVNEDDTADLSATPENPDLVLEGSEEAEEAAGSVASSVASAARFIQMVDIDAEDVTELSGAPDQVEEENGELPPIGVAGAGLRSEVSAASVVSTSARFVTLLDVNANDTVDLSATPENPDLVLDGSEEAEEAAPVRSEASASSVASAARFVQMGDIDADDVTELSGAPEEVEEESGERPPPITAVTLEEEEEEEEVPERLASVESVNPSARFIQVMDIDFDAAIDLSATPERAELGDSGDGEEPADADDDGVKVLDIGVQTVAGSLTASVEEPKPKPTPPPAKARAQRPPETAAPLPNLIGNVLGAPPEAAAPLPNLIGSVLGAPPEAAAQIPDLISGVLGPPPKPTLQVSAPQAKVVPPAAKPNGVAAPKAVPPAAKQTAAAAPKVVPPAKPSESPAPKVGSPAKPSGTPSPAVKPAAAPSAAATQARTASPAVKPAAAPSPAPKPAAAPSAAVKLAAAPSPAPKPAAAPLPAAKPAAVPSQAPKPVAAPSAAATQARTASPAVKPAAAPSPAAKPAAAPSPAVKLAAAPSPAPKPAAAPSPAAKPAAVPSQAPKPARTASPAVKPAAPPSPAPKPVVVPSPAAKPAAVPSPAPKATRTSSPAAKPAAAPSPAAKPAAVSSPAAKPAAVPSPAATQVRTASPAVKPAAAPPPAAKPAAVPPAAPKPVAAPSAAARAARTASPAVKPAAAPSPAPKPAAVPPPAPKPARTASPAVKPAAAPPPAPKPVAAPPAAATQVRTASPAVKPAAAPSPAAKPAPVAVRPPPTAPSKPTATRHAAAPPPTEVARPRVAPPSASRVPIYTPPFQAVDDDQQSVIVSPPPQPDKTSLEDSTLPPSTHPPPSYPVREPQAVREPATRSQPISPRRERGAPSATVNTLALRFLAGHPVQCDDADQLVATVWELEDRLDSPPEASDPARTERAVEVARAQLFSALKRHSQERRQADILSRAPRPDFDDFTRSMSQREQKLESRLRAQQQQLRDRHARESADHAAQWKIEPGQRMFNRGSQKARVLRLQRQLLQTTQRIEDPSLGPTGRGDFSDSLRRQGAIDFETSRLLLERRHAEEAEAVAQSLEARRSEFRYIRERLARRFGKGGSGYSSDAEEGGDDKLWGGSPRRKVTVSKTGAEGGAQLPRLANDGSDIRKKYHFTKS